MILDTSAIVAIVFREPGESDFVHRIGAAATVGIGAPTPAETALLLAARLGRESQRLLSLFVERAGIVVVPFDTAHWQLAADAWLRYGKGRHPVGLNLGPWLT